ncbi:MAG: GGDEF domain-containing protein [Ruminococcus sp.]|nr:GGDEF domain-containing protein [Ruminococcus sp.]
MDISVLQSYVDQCDSISCIMSVEKKPGGYGDIRIVTGNKAYIDSIERNSDEETDIAKEKHFVPNSLYTKYFPHDLNFEDFCYRAAIKKECMHTYVSPERVNFWFNLFFLPVKSDDENVGYCVYTYEITMGADTELMTNIPLQTASNVLQTCLELKGTNDFQTSIDNVISNIRKMCGASRCCLLLTDFKQRKCSLLSLSESPDIQGDPIEIKNFINDDFFDIVSTWSDTIAGSDYLMIKNAQDMQVLKERNPTWYESLAAYNVDNLVLFPLKYAGETKGYIWVTHFDTEQSINIRETLELTTFFIASEISNQQLLRQLEYTSNIDLLTGVYNRNAMNNRVAKLVNGTDSYPDDLKVVFADVNGLKQTNDRKGHLAGDILIKSAAILLQEAFLGQEIYRAGGDEFTVFISNMTDEEFNAKMQLISASVNSGEGVNLALGWCADNGRNDIREDMKEADEKMYLNKAAHYEKLRQKQA